MKQTSRVFAAAVLCAVPLIAQQESGGVDLAVDEHESMREAFGDVGAVLDDWIDRFDVYGFVGARYFDTERGGARPDGAVGIQAATLFFDVSVREVASAFFELRMDYFQEAGQNDVGLGEAYIKVLDVLQFDDEHSLGVKVGRFDLPFGEYYLLEDPNKNPMIGFPALIPYRWDEGIQAFADFDDWGFTASLTDGSYDRSSSAGIGPAATLRLHARPCDRLYLSASGHHVHETAESAICFGGSVITPVAGGVAGTSPSATVSTTLGSFDAVWEPWETVHVQASLGAGRVDDSVDAFDRTFYWWIFEPKVQLCPDWQATARWSGVGTFDNSEGYQFEARPYGNSAATYGFDLSELQRVALGLRHTFASELVGKVEVGFDHLTAIDASGLPNATRTFVALELVFSF